MSGRASQVPPKPQPKKQSGEEFFYVDADDKKRDAELHNAILDEGDHDAAKAVSDKIKARILGKAQQKALELETRAGKKTVVELWPETDESRADFMGRCTTALSKCVGPKKAPRICATKWRKSEKLGKKPEGKSFIARGLDDTDAIEACGETCVGCEGADAPFDPPKD